jgi:poly(A) polymerase Pap1
MSGVVFYVFVLMNVFRAGTVESKLRMLVRDLKDNTPLIRIAHPYIEGKSKVTVCLGDDEIRSAAAGIPPTTTRSEDEPGTSKVWTTTFYIGLDLNQNDKSESSAAKTIGHSQIHRHRREATNGYLVPDVDVY